MLIFVLLFDMDGVLRDNTQKRYARPRESKGVLIK